MRRRGDADILGHSALRLEPTCLGIVQAAITCLWPVEASLSIARIHQTAARQSFHPRRFDDRTGSNAYPGCSTPDGLSPHVSERGRGPERRSAPVADADVPAQ